MAEQDHVAEQYARVAFVYDAWTWLTESKSLGEAIALAKIDDGESILEVATGTGVLFEKILRTNPSGRNVGIDLTEAMLHRARRKARRTRTSFDLRSPTHACSPSMTRAST